MNCWSIVLLLSVVLLAAAGCNPQPKAASTETPAASAPPTPAPVSGADVEEGALPELAAAYAAQGVRIDGKLDEAVWKTAKVYQLVFGKDRLERGDQLQEPGQVQLAWDEKYFYIGIKFYDTDIVAEGTRGNEHHYRMGDLCELFLWPAKSPWYWELYVTPHGLKTHFWFPSAGRFGLPSTFEGYTCGLQVAAEIHGTLNNWHDTDEYWTAEMAMPVADLTAQGDAWAPAGDWRILVARYNFSFRLPAKENTMIPQLSRTNFHLREEYGRIRFEK